MSTPQPGPGLVLQSRVLCPAQSGTGHRPSATWSCTFCIDADTEHTHAHTWEPSGPLTARVPGSDPGLAGKLRPPRTRRRKACRRLPQPPAPKERTLNAVGEAPGPRQAGLRLEQADGAAAGPTHLTGRPGVQALARPSPVAPPAAGTAWTVAPAPTTSTKTQDTTGRPQTARLGRERRGRAAPVNAGGGEQSLCCQVESYVYFLSKALTTSKETLRSSVSTRHRMLVPQLVPAWLWIGFARCPSAPRPQCPRGSPGPAPGVRFLRLGRGRSTEDGWSEAPAEEGGFGGTSAWQRGRCPDGWAVAHSQCMQAPASRGGRGKEGQSPRAGNGCWSSRCGQAALAENQSGP